MPARLTALLSVVLTGCSFGSSEDPDLSTVEQHVIGDYAVQVTSLSPVGYWRFGELSGSAIIDSVPNGNDGIYDGSYVLGIRGAIANDRDTAVYIDQSFTWDPIFGYRYEQGRGTIPDDNRYSLTQDWDDFNGGDGSSTTWGNASGGGAWSCDLSCAASHYNRGGGVAKIYPTTYPAMYEQSRPTTLISGDMQIRVRWLSPAGGGPLVPVALIAQRLNGNHVRAELVEDPNAFDKHSIRIIKRVGGIDQVLDSHTLGTFGDGAWWLVRFRFDGTDLKARAWPEGLDQPQTWQALATTASADSGTVAVRYDNTSGTARPTVEYTDFWVQTLGFSVSMFINVSSTQLAGVNQPFGKSHTEDEIGHDNDEYYFRYEAADSAVKGYVFNRTGGYGAGGRTENITYDKWHHVVFSLDAGDFRDLSAGATFYWDGRKAGVGPVAGGSARNYYHTEHCIDQCDSTGHCEVAGEPEPQLCWLITPLSGNRPVQIGKIGSVLLQGFHGGFDELAIFNRKLTDQEVASLYNSSCQPQMAELAPSNVTATSYYASDRTYAPWNVSDNRLDSRWRSDFSNTKVANNQSITIDLGSVRDIAKAQLVWDAAYAATYDLEVSTDGVNFVLVRRVTKTSATTDLIDIFRTGRYVRMHGLTRATSDGYSLWEFDVFGCDVAP